jgi:cell division protein FtsB
MDGDIVFGKLSVGGAIKKKGAVDVKSQLKKIETQQQKLDKLKSEDKDKVSILPHQPR